MNAQPRERRSGRYAHHDHSAPEVTLHSAYEPGEIARLTEVMENISETFEQLEDLAAR